MVTRARPVPAEVAPPSNLLLPWLTPALAQALQTQRGHALLVHGPEGVGQLSFALGLAKAWLCETDATERPQGLACGHCRSCHLVDERSHPDLRLVVPDALRAEAGLSHDEAAGDDDGKKRKPSREIRVEQVRSALEFSALTAGRGRLKVMVLHPAEAINAIAANALLKTLEEPPGAMRFVLSCGAPDGLLPTIRSRCQDVRLQAPARELALDWLQQQGLQDADALLDATGHQPLQALALAQLGLTGAVWRDFPAAVRQGTLPAPASWTVALLVDALQKLCHDSLMLTLGQAARYFPHSAGLVAGELPRLTAWSKRLRLASARAEHPWHVGLATEALLEEARQHLLPPARSTPPARPGAHR